MNINDRVDQISTTIQELRQASADGRRSRQLVDSLFRTVHSFKATASAEGLTDLSQTAHEFENLLHSLRTGKVALNDNVLRAFDEALLALRHGSQPAAPKRVVQVTPTSGALLPTQFANLKDDERHRATAAMGEGANLYVMNAVFEVNDFDERFRQLKERLEQDAELISTSAAMLDDKIVFQVVYASQSEKIPVHSVLQQAVRAGQATAISLGKQIEFVVTGEELVLEKSVAEAVTDALLHLVRNAVDHGIESHGNVVIDVSAAEISVSDDGRGISRENLALVFQSGFSTGTDVTEFSGRGVGLDAAKTAVEEIGGSVSVTSEAGKGSSFKIKLPNPFKMPNPSSDA